MAEPTPRPIRVVESVADLRHTVGEARAEGRIIGLVPTMGALHEGHASLIRACRREADFVVVSIFVNPTQFGPNEDFARYPRTPKADRTLYAEAGADLAWAPTVEELYPGGQGSTFVEVPGLSDVLDGASRPGHFRGVATVVLKLFQAARPDVAAFGLKDYQQLLVIRRMAADLLLPVRILPVETAREPDGLARSSRNRYLDPEQRRAAAILSEALRRAGRAVAGGEGDADRVRQILRDAVESEGLAQIDYAEVAEAETLEPLADLGAGRRAVALLAVRIGPARLIDNAILPGWAPRCS